MCAERLESEDLVGDAELREGDGEGDFSIVCVDGVSECVRCRKGIEFELWPRRWPLKPLPLFVVFSCR